MADEAGDDPVQQFGTLLEQLQATPYDRELHLQRIKLATKLGLDDEVAEGWAGLASVFPLSEAEWTERIEESKARLPPAGQVSDVQPFLEVTELYRQANKDYLSIHLLTAFASWAISSYYGAEGLSAPPAAIEDGGDEDTAMETADRKVGEPDAMLQIAFSLDEVRDLRQEVMAIAGMHLSQSSAVWAVWRDFEMDLLKTNPTPEQLSAVSQLFLARLAVPHLDIAQTFSAYSSFVTKYDNDNYGEALPAANKIYAPAVKKTDERFAEEAKLETNGFTPQAYLEYISWEREVKRPDIPLVKGLFERAIHDHPREIELWETWIEFLNRIPDRESNLLDVAERATRNLPESVSFWTARTRAAEKLGAGSAGVEEIFNKAFSTGYFDKDMDGTVALYHARASFYRREMDRNPAEDGPDAELVGFVLGVLQEGLKKTKTVHKRGDIQYRLEKYLIHVYERFQMIDEARELWEELTKTRSNSYAVWYGAADFETRQGDFAKAHEVYITGCSAKGLDYPEYLLDAWNTFEQEYGTLADLEFTIVKTRRQRKGLERRRAREAAEAAAAAPQQDADSFIASAVSGQPAASTSAMAIDDGAEASGRKRERDGEDNAAQAKKARVEAPAEDEGPKRDREHSTVFAISPGEMMEEDVRKLFRDCGEIRSLKVKIIKASTYAQIEFVEKESVLAARTKDKKRINEQELEVYAAWQSCLYVTNFPESFDKEKIEVLFEKYGTIFDTRWPSKRFKNTRRFCYVQFANPAHATAALELHGTELEPGHALSVLVSDPSRKKSRTDNNANDRELYISGLARSSNEQDLRRLFEPFGTIKGIRIPSGDGGGCKGFAFVEYEDKTAAQAALTLNNVELKKRHLSVSIAQARQVGTAKINPGVPKETESINRGIRVRGLAPGTEEAIIQQTFEKIAPVQRVNFEEGQTEAVVLFENPADVGKVLMLRTSITIDGTPVEVFGEGRQARTAGGKKPVASSATAKDVPLMPRQATRSRGRVGLAGSRGGRGGRGGKAGIGAAGAAALAAAQSQGGEAAPASSAPAAASTSTSEGGVSPAAAKSQDDFRAMLLKK